MQCNYYFNYKEKFLQVQRPPPIKLKKFDSGLLKIGSLFDIQKKKIIDYYFYDMTQQEIADKDDVSIRTVQYTLNELEKKLKNFIKYH